MRGFLVVLAMSVALAACGQASEKANGGAEIAMEQSAAGGAAAPAMDASREIAGQEAAASNGGSNPSQPAGPTPALYLAYSYATNLELPADALSGMVERHVQMCQSAGPRLCQLIGSNVSGDPESSMNGYVSLRGEPAWLNRFMTGLEAEADAANGRILQETTNTEDLTRAIVDSEARQRAQTTLRDRLQDLLRNRSGRLSDILETERELARVQGEIDSLASNLAVMRTRVAMSELTLSYQSSAKPLRGDTFRPLGDAFASFLGIVVQGFAAIIVLIASLLPFAIVLIPVAWGLLSWRRSRGGWLFGSRAGKAKASDG